jgi:hypothetical protein
MSKNICQCPKPPGGQAICASHQLAICRVKDGEIQTECINPPAGLSVDTPEDRARLANWLLDKITASHRPELFNISDVEEILRRGVFYNSETGETVTFSVPTTFRHAAGGGAVPA